MEVHGERASSRLPPFQTLPRLPNFWGYSQQQPKSGRLDQVDEAEPLVIRGHCRPMPAGTEKVRFECVLITLEVHRESDATHCPVTADFPADRERDAPAPHSALGPGGDLGGDWKRYGFAGVAG